MELFQVLLVFGDSTTNVMDGSRHWYQGLESDFLSGEYGADNGPRALGWTFPYRGSRGRPMQRRPRRWKYWYGPTVTCNSPLYSFANLCRYMLRCKSTPGKYQHGEASRRPGRPAVCDRPQYAEPTPNLGGEIDPSRRLWHFPCGLDELGRPARQEDGVLFSVTR